IITDPDTQIQGGNSFTVVNGSNVDNTALLNGFVITAGNADGSTVGGGATGSGGGVYINNGSPVLTHLLVIGNQSSLFGGGILITGTSSVFISYTIINHNFALQGGGIGIINLQNYNVLKCNLKSSMLINNL